MRIQARDFFLEFAYENPRGSKIDIIYHVPASTAGPSSASPGIASSNRLRLFGLVEPLLFWTVRLPMSHQFLMGWGG